MDLQLGGIPGRWQELWEAGVTWSRNVTVTGGLPLEDVLLVPSPSLSASCCLHYQVIHFSCLGSEATEQSNHGLDPLKLCAQINIPFKWALSGPLS